MNKRKQAVSILAGIMAVIMLLTLVMSLLPTPAQAASSGEIRKQINQLKKEKQEIQSKIKEVQDQYKQNENEIADIIARKNVIDQEVQLLNEQVMNINDQISSYSLLIADKQDELDNAETRYHQMNEENKVRVRAMEEEGEVSYWEVLFKANSFSDLLDRLNMVEEIAAADERHLQEMAEAAQAVEEAQAELETEKADLEATKEELNATQAEMDDKRKEADDLIQELLSKADDLEALELEFQQQDEDFLEQIKTMELAYTAAQQAEWAAAQATATTAANSGNGNNSGSKGGSSGGSGGWVWPCSARRISSPFGYRTAPTSGASSYHQGVDIDGNTGDAVWAAKAGTVVVAGWGSAAGNYVKIDHHDGYSSIYMHLNSYCVSSGTIVNAGQTIGTMGATGVATGDHLHFGVMYNGVYVNPLAYIS